MQINRGTNVQVFYVFQGDFCSLAGFMLICKASSTSSSWHNFVSDVDHWKDENGETPCINSGGMYAAADFMDPMIENGAKNIWSNVKSPTLFGSPKLSAGNFFQKFLKHLGTYYREGQIVFCSFL